MGFKIKIENVVASASLGVPVKLEKLVASIDSVEYGPEQLQDNVFRIDDSRVIFLFGSGKVICTGRKIIEDVKRAVSRADKKLKVVV